MDRIAKIQKLLHECSHSAVTITQFLETPHKYAEEENLYMREVHFLVELGTGSEVIMSEMADRLNVTRGAVTQMVTRLEKKGYLIRTKGIEDKRMTTVALTEKGRKTYQEHLVYDHKEHEIASEKLAAFSDEDLDRLIQYEKIIQEIFTKTV